MDYKKIFPGRKFRFVLLRLLSFVPDRFMLALQYYIKSGRNLNWRNPQRFTEKIQLYKAKYRNPLMGICVDKYEVREYVEQCGLGNVLNEIYGVYDRAEEIDFSKFPPSVVLKTTDGGGGNNVLLIHDRFKIDEAQVRHLLNSWLNVKSINPGREWAYTQMKKSRIIAEKFISPINENGLIDYKFFCFSGRPYVCQIISNRFSNKEHIDFYDMNWNRLVGLVGLNEQATNSSIDWPMPVCFDKMVEIARILSGNFPFVRVDLYNVGGQIYFGELTFYPASGYGSFNPDSFDFELGKQFDIT